MLSNFTKTIIILFMISQTMLFSHGSVTPQPVDTKGLKKLSKKLIHNPYRNNKKAVLIGKLGYEENCARCHGIAAVSGGIAPDLRYLEIGDEGDEWFIEKITEGIVRNGNTYMPSFTKTMSQEAMWAIRAYVESLKVDE